MKRQKLILAAVFGHLLLTLIHGLVHAAVPVFPTGRDAVFATVFLYLLPVIGAGLVVSGRRRVGAILLLLGGVAGLAFEGVLHFLVANPDHVAHITTHRIAFGVTAVLTTASNFLLLGASWLSGQAVWRPANESSATVEEY